MFSWVSPLFLDMILTMSGRGFLQEINGTLKEGISKVNHKGVNRVRKQTGSSAVTMLGK